MNVAGGMSISEPVADLGLVASVASSFRRQPIDSGTVMIGEIGLAGEVRRAQQVPLRVKEIARLGFRRVLIPEGNLPLDDVPENLKVVGLNNISELMAAIF